MVHQRKGSVKAKQQTPGKPKSKKEDLQDLEMDFDMDSDDSGSEEEQVMKKTPGGKTPKGKQSQGDKRVSFQIPGKNTPAQKTPKPDNAMAKKQLTPGKPSALKEFQGVTNSSAKKNGQSKRPAPEDDDDDDDDEEDDDDDDDDEDDDEDADLDMLLGDDDDDDDDDDEDDDEDEEDDDEEEDEQPPKKKQSERQQNQLKNNANKKEAPVAQTKTPVKNKDSKTVDKQVLKGDKTQKDNQSPVKSPVKSPQKIETPVVKKALKLEAERRRDRDLRTLYVGNLPIDTQVTELKALSADIMEVNIPHQPSKNKRAVFAFLEFKNEAKAEENYELLKTKKFRGQPIKVDYTGMKRKSAAQEEPAQDKPINLKKLYVASLPSDVTMDQVAQFFPKSYQIIINSGFSQKHATVFYMAEKDAADALEASKSATLGGKPLTVLYSVSKDRSKNKKRRKNKAKNPPAKKAKLAVKQESDDDDDDDDDDEEE